MRGRNLGLILLIVVILFVASSFTFLTIQNDKRITPNDQFFVVSIASSPHINASNWTLRVDGLVDHPLNLSYDQLRAFPERTEAVTLDCVTGRSATAYWTGTSLDNVLGQAGVKQGAFKVVFHCADGYTTDLTLAEVQRSDPILTWGMNNVTLPVDHGYPLRLVAPDNFGYKWAKFIVEIEVVNYDYVGYWESAGWADDARISPISDWHVHAVLLSIAAVLGGFSALSGMRNSKSATIAKRIPAIFAKKYHRYVSASFYLILFSTFIYWSITTYDLRGAVFYTFHGRIALLTILFSVVGVVSGIPILGGSGKFKLMHWMSNMGAFLLLLITIVLGIMRAIGD